MFPGGPVNTSFPLQTQLVTVDVVRALRGVSADAVQNQVESGALRFVWNVSAKGSHSEILELRFWLREIVEPQAVTKLSTPQVIAIILGEHRQRWRGVEIAQLLMVSRPQIHRLRKKRALSGLITDKTLWVQRAVMEKFLTERCQKSS